MAQSWAESTLEIINHGRFINQFSPNIISFKRIYKKICRQKMSIMFNQICINEEMLPKYIYIVYIYIKKSCKKENNPKFVMKEQLLFYYDRQC